MGKVVQGMDHVKEFYGKYGDNGPKQHLLKKRGIEYIHKDFPLLDNFLTCSVERGKMDVLLPEEAIITQVVEEKNLRSLNDTNQINLIPASVLFFLISIVVLVVLNRNKSSGKKE